MIYRIGCQRFMAGWTLFVFLANFFVLPQAEAQEFRLPAPGAIVHLSPEYNPPILKGIKVHTDNPFRFDFILDKGDSDQNNDQLKQESSKLIKYFLASLTIPEKDLWVNLSPYEKDRIIPQSFGLTEMGRDLLAEDYILKQITASLIYPEDEIGKKFWKRIYEETIKKHGNTNIPVNTFNKVWIVPEKAVVFENAKAGTAYVVESKLKVMLEEDYLSLEKHLDKKDVNALGSQIVREVVIPELTKEVNENQNFAQLRQVYNSLILAAWYKKKIKDSILSQVYSDKSKIAGVNIDDPQEKEKIYNQYLLAFKKGVYNYIKEEQDPITQQPIPRKYFSGGFGFDGIGKAMSVINHISDIARLDNHSQGVVLQVDMAMAVQRDSTDKKNAFEQIRNVVESGQWLENQKPISLGFWVGNSGLKNGKFPATELFSGFKLPLVGIGTGLNLSDLFLTGMEWERTGAHRKPVTVYFEGVRTEKGKEEKIPVRWIKNEQGWERVLNQEEEEAQNVLEELNQIVQTGQWPKGQTISLEVVLRKSRLGAGIFSNKELFSGFKPGQISIGTGRSLSDLLLTGMEWEGIGENRKPIRVHFEGIRTNGESVEKLLVTWIKTEKGWINEEENISNEINKIVKAGEWLKDQKAISLGSWLGKASLTSGTFSSAELFLDFKPGRTSIGTGRDLSDLLLTGMEWEGVGEDRKPVKVHFEGLKISGERIPVIWIKTEKGWINEEENIFNEINKIVTAGEWTKDQKAISLELWVGKSKLARGIFPERELFLSFKLGNVGIGTGGNLVDLLLTGMEWEGTGEERKLVKVNFEGIRTDGEKMPVIWIRTEKGWINEEEKAEQEVSKRINKIVEAGQWPKEQKAISLGLWMRANGLTRGFFPESELFLNFKPGHVGIGTGGKLSDLLLKGMEWEGVGEDRKPVKVHFEGVRIDREKIERIPVIWERTELGWEREETPINKQEKQEKADREVLKQINKIIGARQWPIGQQAVSIGLWMGESKLKTGLFPDKELFSSFSPGKVGIGTGGKLSDLLLTGMEWEGVGEDRKPVKVHFEGVRIDGEKTERIPVIWARNEQGWERVLNEKEKTVQETLDKVNRIVEAGQWPEGQEAISLGLWIGKSRLISGQFPNRDLFPNFKPGIVGTGIGRDLSDLLLTGMEWEGTGEDRKPVKVYFEGLRINGEKTEKIPVAWVRTEQGWEKAFNEGERTVQEVSKIIEIGQWPKDHEAISLGVWLGGSGLKAGQFPKKDLFFGLKEKAIGTGLNLSDLLLTGMEWEGTGKDRKLVKVHFEGVRAEGGKTEKISVTWVKTESGWERVLNEGEKAIQEINKIIEAGQWPPGQGAISLRLWLGGSGLKYGKFPITELFPSFKLENQVSIGTGGKLSDLLLTGMEWEGVGEDRKPVKVHFEGVRTNGEKTEKILVAWIRTEKGWEQDLNEQEKARQEVIEKINKIVAAGQWPDGQEAISLSLLLGRSKLSLGLFSNVEFLAGFNPGVISIGTGLDLSDLLLTGMEWEGMGEGRKLVKAHFEGVRISGEKTERIPVSWAKIEQGWERVLNDEEKAAQEVLEKVNRIVEAGQWPKDQEEISLKSWLGSSRLKKGTFASTELFPTFKPGEVSTGIGINLSDLLLTGMEWEGTGEDRRPIKVHFEGLRKVGEERSKGYWEKTKEGWEKFSSAKEKEEDRIYNEIAKVAGALHGNPGDFLDVLLTLYGDKHKPEDIKRLVRSFEELNLSELHQSSGGGGWGSTLLEFYFQQASLVNQKQERDRQTLIQVFLKIAFRDLMKTESQVPIIEELYKRRKDGIFFEELAEAVRSLVEESMVYQPKHIKTKLLPHQSVAAYFLNSHPRAHLGDFTGAGKTIEVLGAMDPSWKVFVAVPANLIDNWIKELHKHIKPETLAGMEIIILRGSPEKRKQLMDATRNKKNVMIIGSIQSLRKKTRFDLNGLTHGLDLLIVDESQYGAGYKGEEASSNSQQAEALQLISSPRKWYLSATGYGSNPRQLFAMLHALYKETPDEEKFSDYRKFIRLYPTNSAAGLRFLRGEMLKISLSREADEVMDRYEDSESQSLADQGARLPNLKAVSYKELGGYMLNDEQIDILFMMIHNFYQFANWYNQRVSPEKQLTADKLNPFTKLRFIFQLLIDPNRVGGTTESPLWGALDKAIEKYISTGKKGVIYTNNVFLLEAVMERYKHYGVARIDGTMQGYARDTLGNIIKGYFSEQGELVIDSNHPRSAPIDAKTYQKYLFQNDPNYRLIVVNSKAGGVGLDLTAAEFMIHAQLPEFFTQERQLDGRLIRTDLARPRLKIDKVQLVARFPQNLLERYKGTVYEHLAQDLSESGTPAEIQLERLEAQRQVFKYVMTDLASDEELDMFDPTSIGKLIPGFMEDPTMEDYLSSINSNQLKKTIEIFLPLYERAQTRERKEDVLKVAELFYKTGYLDISQEIIDLLAQEDDNVIKLLGAMKDIPNKFARKVWLARVMKLITQDIPTNGIELNEVRSNFDFLSEDELFLVLPIYEVSKGYENGATLRYLIQLLAEIQHTYKNDPSKMLLRFHEILQWLVSVDAIGQFDARDSLKEILEKYGNTLVDQTVSLDRRLFVWERLIRLTQFKSTKEIIFKQVQEGNIESFNEALKEATFKATQQSFGLSEELSRHLVDHFSAILTGLQIKKSLQQDVKYSQESQQLDEIMLHIAQGDFNEWRNKQVGNRHNGQLVTYLANESDFWQGVTAEETIEMNGIEIGLNQHKQQLTKLAGQLQEAIENNDSEIVGDIEGEWVRESLKKWSQNKNFSKELAAIRRNLSQIREKLKKVTSLEGLTESEQEVIKIGGLIRDTPQQTSETINQRLIDYRHLEEWLEINGWLKKLVAGTSIPMNVLDNTLLITKLIGRSTALQLTGFSEQLESLLSLLNRVNEKASYNKIIVQLTTQPDFMLERGMLQPNLIDCFNCFANPRQVSTLVDDLGSRNKFLAIVRDGNGHILARSVVKVKQLEDGKPILFPERPLNERGYDFEEEILEALRKTKLPKLRQWNTQLGQEGRAKDDRVKMFETGGYSKREYFEPLFGVRQRLVDGKLLYHYGVIVTERKETEKVEKPSFSFVGGIGYEGMSQTSFINILKSQSIEAVVDVREVAYSQRPEFSGQNLQSTLSEQRISYIHIKDLGAPKALRDMHKMGKNDKQFLDLYEKYLKGNPKAQRALEALRNQLKGKKICLLCYEANPGQCHRTIILKELARTSEITEPIIDLNSPLIPLFNTNKVDDKAMINNRGGIDFSSTKIPLEVKKEGEKMKFHLDPAMLQQLQNAPGFVPVIISVQPLKSLSDFLQLSSYN